MRSRIPHRLVVLSALIAATIAATSASAQTIPPTHDAAQAQQAPAPDAANANPTTGGRPLTTREHRGLPNYDGRGRPGTSVGDALLWVPRVALFPLYLVTEYGIRTPMGWLVSNAEKAHIPQYLQHFFQPGSNVTFFPTLVVDLGLITSGGFYVSVRNAVVDNNTVRVRAATGGLHYWVLNFADEYTFAHNSTFGMQISYLERADWRFYGIGPNTQESNEAHFDWGRGDVGLFLRHYALHHVGAELTTGFRFDYFGDSTIAPANQSSVPGFVNKQFWYATGRFFLDSRRANAPDSSGARLEVTGMYGHDYRNTNRRWLTYEAEGSLFLELKHPGRVLSLRSYVGFADALGNEPVSFVDLITLGGFESMRGWYLGRFRGESAAVVTLNYRYPVWYFLDGNIYVEAGNTFGHHLEGFNPAHFFGSAGMGFRTVGNRDMSFDILLAVGTSPFDEPFKIDSVRLALGLNRGF